MVKILQAYNFAKQNTFTINGEILSATLIGKNRIAVSSTGQFIEIYDINSKQRFSDTSLGNENEVSSRDERSPQKYSLATVGEVINLIYCEAGNYLLTLEREDVSSPVCSNATNISCTNSGSTAVSSEDNTKMYVRIYANFSKFPATSLIDLPITVRIASMTTPKQPLLESIDVIELPLRNPPEIIQCCQISGNIIVGSKERIYLYEYMRSTHENQQPKFSYIDFFPFKFFINLNFVPLKLCLAENVIACMNNRYCVAFKVVDTLSSGEITSNNVGCNNFEKNISESSMESKVSSSTSSHNSFETDSLETTSSERPNRYPTHSPIDFNMARLLNSAGGHEFEVDLRLQGEDNISSGSTVDAQDILISPARANDIKIKLINEAKALNVQNISDAAFSKLSLNHDEKIVQYDIRRLLQICLKTSEPNGGRVIDVLRCMDLKAIYQREDVVKPEKCRNKFENDQNPNMHSSTKDLNRRSLKSNIHNCCIGYALLVASSVDGYLYQFCSHGKWYKENEKPVSTYSFTAPLLQVHINDYVIFGITTESVETHSSRIGHKVFNNRFEYPSFEKLFPEEYSPDVKSPVSIIGLCSFTHVQYVCVNNTNLVMIINSDLVSNNFNSGSIPANKKNSSFVEIKRNLASRLIAEARTKHNLLRNANAAYQTLVNDWTLYNLELPRVENVIEDLNAIADSFDSDNCSNFYDLMEEAHVMLRLSLSLRFQMDLKEEKFLRFKFMENCRKLADFCIRSKKKAVYSQATGFYKMSNVELIDVYKNYIQNCVETKDNPDEFIGLIHTVKLFLLNLGTERLNTAFSNQQVKPFFTPNRVLEQGISEVPLSLELLNMFIKYAASHIPQIMLSSSVVADSISGELINYLKYLDYLCPEESLLFAVTACRMSNYVLSLEIISKLSRHSLAVALLKYKNVLFDDNTDLTKISTVGQLTTVQQKRLESRFKENCHSSCIQDVANLPPKIISFSDFAETILFTSESQDLIEALSDVFIHALCVENTITLDMTLVLFLNYIGSHVGRKGYQTSQKIFTNILQVYYYVRFDVELPNNTEDYVTLPHENNLKDNSPKTLSNNSEFDNLSLSNSVEENNSATSSSFDESVPTNKCDPYFCHVAEKCTNFKSNNNYDKQGKSNRLLNSEVDLKGLKILFRMYMGRLKTLSELTIDLQLDDVQKKKKRRLSKA